MSLMVLTMIILMGFGVPIAIVLAAGPLLYILTQTQLPLVLIPQRMFVAADSFILTALPFFILAGLLMNEGDITPRLIRVAQLLVGRLRGGLAQVVVVVCMFFGGITGAAVAECSAVGGVLIPAMKKEGYSTEFASGLVASASVMGPIIPPSIPMLVYSLLADTSVGVMFLSGAIPGILIGFSMMGLNYFLVRKEKHYRPKKAESKIIGSANKSFYEKLITVKDGILVLIMPFIIVGGIVGGVFTPTEAAAVSVFYAFFLGFFIYRKIKISRLPILFLETGIVSTVVMFIIATSTVLAWVLAYEEIPIQLSNLFLSFTKSKTVFLIMLIVLLLFVGTFLEPTGALILLVPIILPLAKTLGFDVVHFGTVVVIGMVIGLLTPPVGLCLYIACGLTGLTIEQVTKACLPYICLLIGILLLVAFYPPVSLWLPGVLMGYKPTFGAP